MSSTQNTDVRRFDTTLLSRPLLPSVLAIPKPTKARERREIDKSYALKVVACFIQCNNKLLLLRRSPHKSFAHHWCLPSGKVEKNESLLEAVVRETYEETSLILDPANLSERPQHWFLKSEREVKTPIDLYLFTYRFKSQPIVSVNQKEHYDSSWASLEKLRSGRSRYLLMPDSDKWLLK